MALTQDQKKRFRKLAHHLKPVVTVSESGISPGVMAELDRALEDHELIKVRIHALERADRRAIIESLCQQTGAETAQVIGKVAGRYSTARKPKPRLSNLIRPSS